MSEQWFEAFRDDPDMATSDLFSGRAGVGSSFRLDIPELLYQVFPPSLPDDRAELDRALLAWLEDMRGAYPEQVKRLGFSVYANALMACAAVDAPDFAVERAA